MFVARQYLLVDFWKLFLDFHNAWQTFAHFNDFIFFIFVEFDHKISQNFFWVFDESNEIISLNFKAKIAAH